MNSVKQISISDLVNMKKRGEKFASLTAYDASFSSILDNAGVEVILVGDSLGMVVQGKKTTIPVSMNDMVYHTANVQRGVQRAFIMADMPFNSYGTPRQAMKNASRLMQEGGAHMVKMEGGAHLIDTVGLLASFGIPVCAHLGLLPQSVHKIGGYKIQGKDYDSANQIMQDALDMQAAGADILLLECVPPDLAKKVTNQLDIPTIGIGAGLDCDAQVLVLYDLLGISFGKVPKLSHNFLAENESVQSAVQAYVTAVKTKKFPFAS